MARDPIRNGHHDILAAGRLAGKGLEAIPMKKLRIVLLPFAVVAEVTLLALGWLLAFASPKRAETLCGWVKARLPDPAWYCGKDQ